MGSAWWWAGTFRFQNECSPNEYWRESLATDYANGIFCNLCYNSFWHLSAILVQLLHLEKANYVPENKILYCHYLLSDWLTMTIQIIVSGQLVSDIGQRIRRKLFILRIKNISSQYKGWIVLCKTKFSWKIQNLFRKFLMGNNT